MVLFLQMISAGENICDIYNRDFTLMGPVFVISVKRHSLNFAMIGGTLVCLQYFARRALSIFDCNLGHNFFRLFDVLLNFPFTTSETND